MRAVRCGGELVKESAVAFGSSVGAIATLAIASDAMVDISAALAVPMQRSATPSVRRPSR